MDKNKIQQQLKYLLTKANNFFNQEKDKQRTVASMYVIFSFIALAFFGLFAISPTITAISGLNKKFDDDNAVLADLTLKNKSLAELGTKYQQLLPNLDLLSSAIPAQPNVAQLTRKIEVLTTQNNLVLLKLTSGLMEIYPVKNVNNPVFSYSFSVSVQGSQTDVNQFIKDLISMDRIIGIDKLSTGKLQGDTYTASIEGDAYFDEEKLN